MASHHTGELLDPPAGGGAGLVGWVMWWQAVVYCRRGLALAGRQPGLYGLATLVYMTPALVAAALMAQPAAPSLAESVAIAGLPWVTAVLGTVVTMVLVGRHARGEPADLARATVYALTWVPRYLWTNAHTTVIFWMPVGLLLQARAWQETAGPALTGLWWLVVGLAALYCHTRTLLAPFLAVHADLPATQATLEAWRLSGRHLMLCLSTFVLASLPAALPLAALSFGATLLLPGILAALERAAPALIWAAIQAVRPVLMPAVYLLYTDLWSAEAARRAVEGEPPVPLPLRVLLRLTRPLPKLGRPW